MEHLGTQAENNQEPKLEFINRKIRVCFNPNHLSKPVQMLCLEEECKKDRLLCIYCFFERHKNHNITLITSPFNQMTLLKMNSQRSDSQIVQSSIKDCRNGIFARMNQLQLMVQGFLKEMNSSICFEIQTLYKTLDKQTYQQAIKQLLDSESQVDIENYVKMLKFLNQFKEWSSKECLSQIVNTRKRLFYFMLQEFKNKITKFHSFFLSDISKISMSKPIPLRRDIKKNCPLAKKNKFEQKRGQLKIQETNLEKKQEKIKKYRKLNQNIKTQTTIQSQKLSKTIVQLDSQKIQNIDCLEVQPVQKLQKGTQKKTCFGYRTLLLSQANQQNLNAQLKKRLSRLKQKVDRLVISNNTDRKIIGDQTIKIMIRQSRNKLSDLKCLRLTWSCGLTKQRILAIAAQFPKLRELVLNCQGVENQSIINKLIKYLPGIQRLHFGIDTLNQLQNSIICQEFFHLNTSVKIKTDLCLKMSEQLSKLQNIEISIFNNHVVEEIIKNMKHLKQLSIGQQYFVDSKRNPFIDNISLFDTLATKTELLSLTINSLNLSKKCQVRFSSIFSSFPRLKVLQLFEVKGASDAVLQAVQINCRQLKALSLFYNDLITGKNIWEMVWLNSLTISACWGISSQFAASSIKGMNRLKFLNISFNYAGEKDNWVTHEFMQNLACLKGIQHLLINDNQINDQELISLGSFDNLKTLICGKTKITGVGLEQFLKKNRTIQKLSISGLNGDQIPVKGKISTRIAPNSAFYGKVTDQQFLILSQLMSCVTHLNTRNNLQIDLNKHIKMLGSLTLLCYTKNQLTKQSQLQIEKKGVVLRGHLDDCEQKSSN